jgi:hypothetical protein
LPEFAVFGVIAILAVWPVFLVATALHLIK